MYGKFVVLLQHVRLRGPIWFPYLLRKSEQQVRGGRVKGEWKVGERGAKGEWNRSDK